MDVHEMLASVRLDHGFGLLFVIVVTASLSALAVLAEGSRLSLHGTTAAITTYVSGSVLSDSGLQRLMSALEDRTDVLDNQIAAHGPVQLGGLLLGISGEQAKLSPMSSDLAVLERYVSALGNGARWPALKRELLAARASGQEQLAYYEFEAAIADRLRADEFRRDVTPLPHGSSLDLSGASPRVLEAATAASALSPSTYAGPSSTIFELSAAALDGEGHPQHFSTTLVSITSDGRVRQLPDRPER